MIRMLIKHPSLPRMAIPQCLHKPILMVNSSDSPGRIFVPKLNLSDAVAFLLFLSLLETELGHHAHSLTGYFV